MTRAPALAPATAAARPVDGSSAVTAAAAEPAAATAARLGVVPQAGLSTAEAAARAARFGPNAVGTHHTRLLAVLWHQLRSPLLALLLAGAVASYFVGQRNDAVIIGVIVALSVGLGFGNEYRAERSADALHDQLVHRTVVLRDGRPVSLDVTALVPGDIVRLHLGDVVPADVRLLEASGLQCDESVLTGESLPVEKDPAPVAAGTPLADLTAAALMGTVVHAGSATGVVVATGARTEFGAIAAGLRTHHLDTEFQIGLRRFSMLLVYVGLSLTVSIFVVNVLLHRPVIDALLFSLAIAVGITPQLLPAIVSTSLAAGSRRMAKREVLVKRLVCIEDLGNVDVLFTDKTGTLTLGHIDLLAGLPVPGRTEVELLTWGLLCTENEVTEQGAVGGNPLDQALWDAPAARPLRSAAAGYTRVGILPFDHERMLVSTVVRGPDGGLTLVTKGAPEALLPRCGPVPPEVTDTLQAQFAAGYRVVALATRPVTAARAPAAADEQGLELRGFLAFLDPPKPDAAASLRRLADLGIAVRIVTGDNAVVARKVCGDLGLGDAPVLTGTELGALSDAELAAAIGTHTVFARVSPEDKARIVRVQRHSGGGVAFLGDGVNDALALHAADVGISVDSATTVAKDAADVILLRKDLGVLADGVVEGRRIFANTIKYVLMGTSSNFGNMFSAAGASLFLSFLPMLPSQILLNNLLYDTGQLAIPTDHVDPEQLHRPSHWDIGFIRRFMLVFGPLSSLFDFATFAIMLWALHAHAPEFRSGWFVESLATQTLVIFAIRTRRVPFFRSRPSVPITVTALATVAVGAVLPLTPLAHRLGFRALPWTFFAALLAMIVAYLVLIETAKRFFYRAVTAVRPQPRRPYSHQRHLARRAVRFHLARRRRTGAAAPARPARIREAG